MFVSIQFLGSQSQEGRCRFYPSHRPTLQRQNKEILKQIFPEKEYRGLSPNFHIHASVSHLYISTIGLPILLEEICRPILGLYKSHTDTWMLKLGLRPRYSQKRNTYMGFSLQCRVFYDEVESHRCKIWHKSSDRFKRKITNHLCQSLQSQRTASHSARALPSKRYKV